jgi:hypothetical protein
VEWFWEAGMPNFYFFNRFLTSGILIFAALGAGRLSAQDLGVGEWSQETDEKCFENFCLRNLQLQLHPRDPFLRPQLKFSVQDAQRQKPIFDGSPCGKDQEVRWRDPFDWGRAAVLVDSAQTEDKKVQSTWTLSVCLHRQTGEIDWPESFVVFREYSESKIVKDRILKLRKS